MESSFFALNIGFRNEKKNFKFKKNCVAWLIIIIKKNKT